MNMIDERVKPTDSTTDGEVATTCSVCAHPLAAHDQIAVRFCNATVAGQHDRGCVCATTA